MMCDRYEAEAEDGHHSDNYVDDYSDQFWKNVVATHERTNSDNLIEIMSNIKFMSNKTDCVVTAFKDRVDKQSNQHLELINDDDDDDDTSYFVELRHVMQSLSWFDIHVVFRVIDIHLSILMFPSLIEQVFDHSASVS